MHPFWGVIVKGILGGSSFFGLFNTVSAYVVGTCIPGDIIAENYKNLPFSRKPAYRATGLGLSALAALAFFLVMENRNIENYRIQLFNRLDNLRAIIYKNYDISSSRLDTYNETMYYSGKYLLNLSSSLNVCKFRLINY